MTEQQRNNIVKNLFSAHMRIIVPHCKTSLDLATETASYFDLRPCLDSETNWIWEMSEQIFHEINALPQLSIDAPILVGFAEDIIIYPRHFKSWEADNKVLCFADGKTSFSVSKTPEPAKTFLWSFWKLLDQSPQTFSEQS